MVVRLRGPLVDYYLEFLEGQCRPNTVLAAAYHLRVFFGVVGTAPAELRSGGYCAIGIPNGYSCRHVDFEDTSGAA